MATRKPTPTEAVVVEPGSRIIACPAHYERAMGLKFEVVEVVGKKAGKTTFRGRRLTGGTRADTEPREYTVTTASIRAYEEKS